MTICAKALEEEAFKWPKRPLWFLLSILTRSSWQRHRSRFTHWETVGIGWVGKGVLWSQGGGVAFGYQRAPCLRVGSAEVATEGSPLGQSQRGQGSSPGASRDGKAPSSCRPTPQPLAQAVAEAGEVALGDALVEAQGGEGEPSDSPGGVLALRGRAGWRRSSFALTCAAGPASHQSVGALPIAAVALGLPLHA